MEDECLLMELGFLEFYVIFDVVKVIDRRFLVLSWWRYSGEREGIVIY